MAFHSGFVAIVGRPNVGKSTLINSFSGQKVAITSSRPQTTRHRIMGIKNGKGYQIVFVDTPGVVNVKNELDSFMEKIYKEETKEADAVLFVVDGNAPVNDEDKLALSLLEKPFKEKIPVFLIINKSDKFKTDENVSSYMALAPFEDVFVVSAVHGTNLDNLERKLVSLLPEGVEYFPQDMVSDQSSEVFVQETVRENILQLIDDEIPHGVFVRTEESHTKNDTLYFKVVIYVEREAHKGIIIGKEGKMLKRIGASARREAENTFNKKVYLDLWVKVKEKWRNRKDLLRSWGY